MGFGGGSAPTPPPAQPVTPVPQEDDPKNLETQRKTAMAAKGREGYSAHLLSKGGDGDKPEASTSSTSKLLG